MKNKKWCVYMHISPSNKKYIGITSLKPEYRWKKGEGYRTQTVFYRAIQKYGWDNFSHIILFDGLTEEDAKNIEKDLISKYKTNLKRYQNPSYGYNNDDGGNSCSSLVGIPLSEHHKEKVSNSLYHDMKKVDIDIFDINGKYLTSTHGIKKASQFTNIEKTNICKCLKGKVNYMGNYMFKYHTETKVDDIDPYKKPVHVSSIPVSQYSLSGEFIKTYPSANEAARSIGVKNAGTNILSVCHGLHKTSHGYYWSFEENKNGVHQRENTFKDKKEISSYLLDGSYDKTYSCYLEASEDTGANRGLISACAHGRRKIAGNRMWKLGHDKTPIEPYKRKMKNGEIKTWNEIGMNIY